MNLCDRNEIQELLRRHGFRFSKSMGQNFLIESWVPEDIAAASGADRLNRRAGDRSRHRPPDPAAGPAGGKVVSVELDRRLYPVLRETMADFDNFTLLEGDAMKLPLRQTVKRAVFPVYGPFCVPICPITSPHLSLPPA